MSVRIDEIGFGGLRLMQETDEFCYGIDAVLLSSFASHKKHDRIIDLGTNNGVIPIILSNLTDAGVIAGIEIQTSPSLLAKQNVAYNGLDSRIQIINDDIINISEYFKPRSFDAVTCNPPYAAMGTSIINDSDSKAVARHETSANLEDFIKAAAYLLTDGGTFYLVHRPSRLVDISYLCRKHKIEPKLMRFVSPRRGEKPNILLAECRKNAGRELKIADPLFVYNEDGTYSEEIEKIYKRK